MSALKLINLKLAERFNSLKPGSKLIKCPWCGELVEAVSKLILDSDAQFCPKCGKRI